MGGVPASHATTHGHAASTRHGRHGDATWHVHRAPTATPGRKREERRAGARGARAAGRRSRPRPGGTMDDTCTADAHISSQSAEYSYYMRAYNIRFPTVLHTRKHPGGSRYCAFTTQPHITRLGMTSTTPSHEHLEPVVPEALLKLVRRVHQLQKFKNLCRRVEPPSFSSPPSL